MKTLRLILGDQLTESISSLNDVDKANDLILLCEVKAEATYVKHHPQKIAFLFSAMRHFAGQLKQSGFAVKYVKLDDAGNTGSFEGEVARCLAANHFQRIVVTEPGEYRLLVIFNTWAERFALPVEIRPDTRFLCSIDDFKRWAQGKKQLRMEFFYRDMRKRYRILIDANGKPTGGLWNYDKDNRKPPTAGLIVPARPQPAKTAIVHEVIKLISDLFKSNFGALEPFDYAVTRKEALAELQFFIDKLLPLFGDYQDAMVAGQAYLFHSKISAYLNAGLLLPLEICQMAEQAYREGKAPLNAVEGFIRQILGWREYVRGIYWLNMPEYSSLNYLDANRPLPGLYWGAETAMFCMAEAIRNTRDYAYSHHIQRLMITGNFALLAGLDPKEVCAWYLAVYADAYEWVELPNTLGMALFADGGMMASKPYAASGKYIKRMSNFCQQCQYDPNLTVGNNACPFNALYWDFLARNETKLASNQRLTYVYANWRRMDGEAQKNIIKQANTHLQKIAANEL